MGLAFIRDRVRQRPTVSAYLLTALGVVWSVAVYNQTFLAKAADIFSDASGVGWLFVAAVVLLWAGIAFAFSARWLVRPFWALVFVLGAATSHGLDRLGVIIDRDMIHNIAATTVTEGKHLITPDFVLWVFVWGVVPAVLVLRVRIAPENVVGGSFRRIGLVGACLAAMAGLLYLNLGSYISVLRAHRDLMASFLPVAPVFAAGEYVGMMRQVADAPLVAIGQDAKAGPRLAQGDKPVVAVLIIGETARAQNFGLQGYERPTTPQLAQRDIVYFENVQSCGTATAVSLPCMFSKFGRKAFDYAKGVSNENLLDVLGYAGFSVHWLDNNTGDKGLAARQNFRQLNGSADPVHCEKGECRDGVFQAPLREILDQVRFDTVIVLHQIGSHGPAYYLRYTEAERQFRPDCRSADFTTCTDDEIRNAYDNTIVATDAAVANVIDELAARDDIVPVLLYVSDHGESLGEGGLYLHGAPYFTAPDEQTHVPMILWAGAPFEARFNLSQTCLQSLRTVPLSHDNLFHGVLGLLDVVTAEYVPALDPFVACIERKNQG